MSTMDVLKQIMEHLLAWGYSFQTATQAVSENKGVLTDIAEKDMSAATFYAEMKAQDIQSDVIVYGEQTSMNDGGF